MAIIPIVRCTRMKASLAFYTRVLDVEYIDGTTTPAIHASAFSCATLDCRSPGAYSIGNIVVVVLGAILLLLVVLATLLPE